MTKVIIFCAFGTCLCFTGLAYLQTRVSNQATQGQAARSRQQQTYPVSLKVYRDAYRSGVITAADLACFESRGPC